jgi:hypothetical protein
MSVFDKILNWEPFSRVRRNHALEHATLQVLAEKYSNLRLAGYSDPGGFWLVGNIETSQVEEGARQALVRLQNGESQLAIHPHCGTNLVTTSLVAGAFAWLGMLGMGRSSRERVERLPAVITLVTLAMMVSQPLGPMVQARVTTSAAAQGMEIVKIERLQRGDVPLHRVVTRF